MKNCMKKFSVLLMALVIMMSMLAACGGGASSSEDGGTGEAEEQVAAEPNTGVRGIVFEVPDDWNLYYAGEGTVGYRSKDTVYFWGSSTTEETLKEMKEYNTDVKAETVEEYYNELISDTEDLEKTSTEAAATKIGDWDATELKTTNEAGELVGIAVRWLYDGTMYMLDVSSTDMYDEDGNFNKNSTALGDDIVAKYESVVASVQPGDGETLKMSKVDATSIGGFTYEAPEGYKLESYSENYINYVKDGSKIRLSINRTTEEELKYHTDENGNAPQSLQEDFNNQLHEGMEMTTIAGCEGYKFLDNTYLDGNIYFQNAGFLAEDAEFTFHIGGDAWDDEGNLKEDAEALTDEDKATFEKLIDSFSKK